MTEISFSEIWYWLLLCAAVCYLIGCFNFAVLISHFKHRDIRGIGSGNPGSMNMTRTFGLKVGAMNFFCDVIKGGLPAVIAWVIFKDYIFAGTALPPPPGMGWVGFTGGILVSDFMRYFCGLFVIIGHIFPVTMKFKGGKGIASTMGLFSFALPCEIWWYFPIAVVFLFGVLAYIAVTEWGSMGSLIGVTGLSIWQTALFIVRYRDDLLNPWVAVLLMIILLINVLTWVAHRKNIFKLLAGEEHRTSVRKRKKRT
ncbi:MAG: glycerol-3-phosphate acyltransferase [Clostridia bacterium]|nr:glycerol-3-phosphate acyltransferase [Clostridia bacterium]